jgi:hypothetical protein
VEWWSTSGRSLLTSPLVPKRSMVACWTDLEPDIHLLETGARIQRPCHGTVALDRDAPHACLAVVLRSGATSLYLVLIVCTQPSAYNHGKYAEQGY